MDHNENNDDNNDSAYMIVRIAGAAQDIGGMVLALLAIIALLAVFSSVGSVALNPTYQQWQADKAATAEAAPYTANQP